MSNDNRETEEEASFNNDEVLLTRDDGETEEAVIQCLEAARKPEPLDGNVDDELVGKIEFICSCCGMNEKVHYFGKTPPFTTGIQFSEDTFVMRDIFQPAPPRGKAKAEYFIAMGANCVECGLTVCKDNECNFFYCTTYCLNCANAQIKKFPLEIQTKLRKQLTEKTQK